MTTTNDIPTTPITDILRRMVDLARQVEPQSPGGDRMAKIAMQMAMDSIDPEHTPSTIETMLMRRVAEEKERRRERDQKWAERVKSVERRMLEEREQELEWQEIKFEAARKRDEANVNAVREELARVQAELELARRGIVKAKEDAQEAMREVERTKKETGGARKEVEQLKDELKRSKAELERAKEETERERERADRAEAEHKQVARRANSESQSAEEKAELIAWSRYKSQWRLLKRVTTADPAAGQLQVLRFEDLPWPTVVPPTSPTMITDAEVAAFLRSGPPLREGESMRARIKDSLLTWHPDKFAGRWIQYVIESDRARVTDGITAVVRAGSRALAEYTSRTSPPKSRVPTKNRITQG
ncbi:hypothetical protein ACGC1H_005443 [Rhizoctonia solani]|uniref:Uncharacterized protein n=1 Tax=Rhizoctonia solani TaxID=456999 RepID=A0A8H3GZF1_9AGAM|nr:unnamed protein product [Rhizoctonia solani]